MKIAFGCDHAGIVIKDAVIKYLNEGGYIVKDFGCYSNESCDYPDFAIKVARAVSLGEYDRGILSCGTGIGMCIVANKFPKIRAAVCWEPLIAKLAAEHNNANIICLPARFITIEKAILCINQWLTTPFSKEERHIKRVDKITMIENNNFHSE